MPMRQKPTEYESRQLPPQPGVTAKTPGIAVLLSMIFPGAGHFYANKTASGVVIIFAMVLIWIGAMKSSYKAAIDFNRRNGFEMK
jgi:TM2 domain-containing membrane protein YozV